VGVVLGVQGEVVVGSGGATELDGFCYVGMHGGCFLFLIEN
jgi:hypothetical protein